MGAASCGLAVNSLHSPCAPLLPVWGVDRARHTVPPPPGRLALPSPPHRHPLHARASGSAAAACRGPPDHRLAAPFPPRCLQRKYARRAARHHRKPGGRVGKSQLGSMLATVSAALAVVTLAWGCAAPSRSSEVSSSVLGCAVGAWDGADAECLLAFCCCLQSARGTRKKPQTPPPPPGDKPTGLREAWRARPPLGAARLWFGCE